MSAALGYFKTKLNTTTKVLQPGVGRITFICGFFFFFFFYQAGHQLNSEQPLVRYVFPILLWRSHQSGRLSLINRYIKNKSLILANTVLHIRLLIFGVFNWGCLTSVIFEGYGPEKHIAEMSISFFVLFFSIALVICVNRREPKQKSSKLVIINL